MDKRLVLAALLALSLPACGGGGGGNPVAPPVTQPPIPAVSITATGGGALVLHPSVNPRFTVAMATPIRIIESGGGTADWHFARMSIFRRNVEIERTELDANVINAAGFGRINASSNQVYRVTFRFNSQDFDRLDLTLGFGDRKDGRQFSVLVPFNSFTDVQISPTPAKGATPAGPAQD